MRGHKNNQFVHPRNLGGGRKRDSLGHLARVKKLPLYFWEGRTRGVERLSGERKTTYEEEYNAKTRLEGRKE